MPCGRPRSSSVASTSSASVADLLGPEARTATVAGGLSALDDVADHDGAVARPRLRRPGLPRHRPGARPAVRRRAAHRVPRAVVGGPRLRPPRTAVGRRGRPAPPTRATRSEPRPTSPPRPTGAVLCGPEAPPEAVPPPCSPMAPATGWRPSPPGWPSPTSRHGRRPRDHRRRHPRPPLGPGRRRPGARSAPTAPPRRPAGRRLRPPGRDDHQARGPLGRPGQARPSRPWRPVGRRRGQRQRRHRGRAGRARPAGDRRRAPPDDAERIVANAAALGAVVEVVVGGAPDVLADLPGPTGPSSAAADSTRSMPPGTRRLRWAPGRHLCGGRPAAAAHRRLGSLVQVAVDRAETLPDGGVRFAADNPVFVAWGDRPDAADSSPYEPTLIVGIGCSTTATADDVVAAIDDALADSSGPARTRRSPRSPPSTAAPRTRRSSPPPPRPACRW